VSLEQLLYFYFNNLKYGYGKKKNIPSTQGRNSHFWLAYTVKELKVTSPQYDTALSPNVSSLQKPIQNLHSFRRYRAKNWAKIKGHIITIPPRNTPLSPNTSSLQIPNPKSAFI
jgi:hypothetical protein